MGGVAQLARSMGYRVTGSDANIYPPMSTQLEAAGIDIIEGYDPEQLDPATDLVVVGNAMSRGNPVVEAILDKGLAYTSGPQWLGEALLRGKWVLAVAGTHGKTTTTSILAWLLEHAGMNPGFLVGGVPLNFGQSARAGGSDFFVIEADEYDTAFFDKRSKFLHYRPRTVVLGNLEFDHADIFPDLAAIERQFHHLIRCVPSTGLVIRPAGSAAIDRVIAAGCWTPQQTLMVNSSAQAADWQVTPLSAAGEEFLLRDPAGHVEQIAWSMLGEHNLANACAAAAAAHHVGLPLTVIADGLRSFKGVKRRLELRGTPRGIEVFDDFAHHPTAISYTLETMSKRLDRNGRVIAVIEPRSNSMRSGVHAELLPQATQSADYVFWYQPPGQSGKLDEIVSNSLVATSLHIDLMELVDAVASMVVPGDSVVIMSNGGFGGFHKLLLDRLAQ